MYVRVRSEARRHRSGVWGEDNRDRRACQHQRFQCGLEDYVSAREQEIIKDWAVFGVGLFAAFAVTFGLNNIVQEQWDHSVLDYSGSTGSIGGAMSAGLEGLTHMSILYSLLTVGLFGSVLLGIALAGLVDNEENTAYKVGAVLSLVGIPLLFVLGTFLYTIRLDDWGVEFANLLVSGIASGVVGAIGTALSIYVTEQHSPSALDGWTSN